MTVVNDSPLTIALKHFEATEANLLKLESLWTKISSLTPEGIVFGGNVEYEDRLRSFEAILAALPLIDGWKPTDSPIELNDIAQWRLDAKDCGEITAEITIEEAIEAPGKAIREYRHKFNQKRRELIRDALVKLIDQVDAELHETRKGAKKLQPNDKISEAAWVSIRNHIDEIDALLGSSVQRTGSWSDLRRHMHFGMIVDLDDIEKRDWPSVKKELRQGLYGAHEPTPVAIEDLSHLVAARPTGTVTTKLNWRAIDAETFERLIFSLISMEENYENPEWLGGRDRRSVTSTLSGITSTSQWKKSQSDYVRSKPP